MILSIIIISAGKAWCWSEFCILVIMEYRSPDIAEAKHPEKQERYGDYLESTNR
jgi:hypothetical protein